MSKPSNGTFRPVVVGIVMTLAGLLPATFMAVENTTVRAIIIAVACLLFLTVGLFLPQPTMPESFTGRKKIPPPDEPPDTPRDAT